MKIYFAASIRGGRNDVEIYKELINYLKNDHQVLTEHIGDYNLSIQGQNQLEDSFIRNRDIDWLKQSDIVIAEATNPSLGVGYELAMAERLNKPVIVLHRSNGTQLSAMIAGTEYFTKIFEYQTVEEAEKILGKKLKRS